MVDPSRRSSRRPLRCLTDRRDSEVAELYGRESRRCHVHRGIHEVGLGEPNRSESGRVFPDSKPDDSPSTQIGLIALPISASSSKSCWREIGVSMVRAFSQ